MQAPLPAALVEQPRYLVVARALASSIASGQLRAGDRLPGERTICSSFRVSRVTVRRALLELQRQSLVEASAARGWFVTGNLLGEPNMLISFTEMASERSLTPTTRVLEVAARRPTLEESELLMIPAKGRLLDLRRVRGLNGIPIAVERSRLALHLAPQLEGRDFARGSLYEALRAGDTWPTRSDYELEAVLADDEQAKLLSIHPGEALQRVMATTFDQLGRAIELSENYVRGDHYRFRARLFAPPPVS
jgi:GntR family transcriptional regulator